jgi:hypothetical protein
MNECVKEVWRLWGQTRFDTFHKFLLTVEALWQIVIHVGKQVLVSRSKDQSCKEASQTTPN